MCAEKIRESIIAGSWYPGDPGALASEVRKFLAEADPPKVEGNLIGLVSPHAGFMYSGAVAAHAYKLLEDHPFDRVLIVAPSHRAHFQGASVYNLGGYRTPLGVVPLDRKLVDDLFRESSSITYVPEADSQEHSLEIQLPFLQVVLKQFRLTPIIMGEQSRANVETLAAAIANVCRGKKVLLVASSDLSHYHPYETAGTLDGVVTGRVGAFDPDGLWEALRTGSCEACGAGPILAVMLAARRLGANSASILRYANSGDVTGKKDGVVGYMSAAFHYGADAANRKDDGGEEREVGTDLGFSPEEKKTLREVAVRAIRSKCLALDGDPEPSAPPGRLWANLGAFVSIHKDGELRGCIGLIEGRGPLIETVKKMAIQAAFSDPRFACVKSEELDRLELEISVLTPLERIKDVSRIEIGKHGLIVRKGYHSGLLLPQVATEHKCNRVQFLEFTCRKAGLSPEAWKDPDAEIYIFSADVF